MPLVLALPFTPRIHVVCGEVDREFVCVLDTDFGFVQLKLILIVSNIFIGFFCLRCLFRPDLCV